ncbi:MAG: ribose-phosphate diphosphokinase [Gemmatimonadota bacterium]
MAATRPVEVPITAFSIFGGPAHSELTHAVARELDCAPSRCTIERFPDGEVSVRIEEPVRGQQVYFIQPTSPPVDTHLVQLLAFIDAARRAGAQRISVVIPYFGYARSDRRHGCREAITARLVADLLEAAGADHLVTIDLHTLQIEGFFHIPVDTLTAVETLCHSIEQHLPPDLMVVSPDAGRVPMATEYATRLGSNLAVLHKRRESGSKTHVTHLVGDVRGRACLLVDDMISTGGTIVESTQALRDAGATEIYVSATHGLLIENAWDRLMEAGVRELFVTDTVPVRQRDDRLHVISIAELLASAIRRYVQAGTADHSWTAV